MANRHKDFNEMLAKEFEDLEFSRAYIMNLINDEDYTLEDALKETVKAMGLQAFARKAGVPVQRISDFVAGRRRFKSETIEKIVETVFKLKIRVTLELPV